MDYERERRRKKRYREAMRNRIIAAVLLAGIIVGAIFIIKGCKKDDAPVDEDQNQPAQDVLEPVDDQPKVDDELLTLVNPWNPLPDSWTPDLVTLSDGRQALALFAVADPVRPESRQAVDDLHALGIRTVMLTGDNPQAARSVATTLGIDDVRAGLLPEDKLAAIEGLMQSAGAHAGMVGDGINDAPALARAQVGFAMGAAGSDTAIETADVALMDDDPRKLARFVRLARQAGRVLRQNLVLALGIKLAFLALTVAGLGSMWMAVFADVGASLLVIANGLRLLRA